MNINEMRDQAHNNAVAKGFYEGAPPNVPEKLMLIVTEVAEAMEDYRTNTMYEAQTPEGKPIGFPSEIADVVIRIGDLCGLLDIDLEGAIERKMAYNETRSHRHGGKKA